MEREGFEMVSMEFGERVSMGSLVWMLYTVSKGSTVEERIWRKKCSI
jgi:hypothetical protein